MIKTAFTGAFGLLTIAAVVATAASAHDHGRYDRGYVEQDKDGVRVEAPHTRVDVDRDRARTRVEAPYTSVDVDRERRTIRIRVPYFNGDIRY